MKHTYIITETDGTVGIVDADDTIKAVQKYIKETNSDIQYDGYKIYRVTHELRIS